MTFEEFFKKKKIDLVQLKAAEPALFAEFESHYAQMGEKSFDHTKKYWFNNLRRLYHTPEEPKVEKVKIENPLAEQTIIDSVTEKPEAAPAPKVGFTPRFKSGATRPATEQPVTEESKNQTPAVAGTSTTDLPTEARNEESPKPKVGFTPRFKAGVTKPASVAETEPKAEESVRPAVVGVVTNNQPTEAKSEDNSLPAEETPKPKIGFTPRFKAGVTKPKKEEGKE
ncbi:hypothetical protein BEL04_15295 [Mucilaginibacter sp. PPCGB 2223]|uniref:hypothetical protein n=1 Tax=Mucilaginibacter sp. PPCGB 2223 TaxID=1886027 RepID=UPI0008247A92|nr:hypothetical protein [Mucilaginibacter sp. PPCGB 2223]OCX51392.1 hypothetical protein BEL04_15295 [Mucilaginibacter sp. PPCGB 2223]